MNRSLTARRMSLTLGVVLGAALLGGASPAAAGGAANPAGMAIDPTAGPHSGNTGVHKLIDSYEFPTICKYDGTTHKLKKIQIRRPIVFAYNRTNHVDSEKVGWRYRVEYIDAAVTGNAYQELPDLYASPIMKADATDQVNADFDGQTYVFSSAPTHDYYRVSIQMTWYYPNGTHKDGRAVHSLIWYLGKDPVNGNFLQTEYCSATGIPPEL